MRQALVTNLFYERNLRRIANGRHQHLISGPDVAYVRMPGDYEVVESDQGYIRAIKAKDKEIGRSHALLLLTHGLPDRVLLHHTGDIDTPYAQAPLLSLALSDDAMSAVAKDRDIYIFACRVAYGEGRLVQKLKDAGATSVSAFQGKPAWKSSEGLRLWQQIDGIFCRAVAEEGGSESMHKGKYVALEMIQAARTSRLSDDQYAAELADIESVVNSIIIL